MRVCVAAMLAAWTTIAVSTPGWAQATSSEPAAQPQPATPLPAVTVETTQQPKKSAAKKKSKQKAATAAPAAPAPQPPPAAASTSRGAPASGTGPVDGYAATSTTTGIKTDTPLREIPQSVSVVGQEQIRDQGAQTLQETLRYVPGVIADAFGLDSRGDYAFVRGISAAFFLDGLRTTYGYYVNTIPAEPYGLERVEVLRGPASMLYGQATTGGIINMVSKMPQEQAYNEIGVDYGSFDFKQLRFDSTGAVTTDKKWLYRIVGLVRDAETQVDYVDNDRVFIAPSLTYRPTNDTSITLMGTYRNDNAGSVQQFFPHVGTLYPNPSGQKVDFSTFIGEPTDYYDTEQRSVSLFVEHKFSDALKLNHASRYSYTDNQWDTHFAASTILPEQLASFNETFDSIADSVLGPGDYFLFDPNSAPFTGPDKTNIARVHYIKSTQTEVFNQDTNLVGKFVTGDIGHKVLAGYDYMRYSTGGYYTPTLLDNALPPWLAGFGLPGQAEFNMFDPVYGQTSPIYVAPDVNPPFAPLTFIDTLDEVQQQHGLYIQDQLRWGPWIAVLGVRHDWLQVDLEGSATERDTALSRRAGLMYEFDFGLTPYVSWSESFTPQPGQPVVDSLADVNNPNAVLHSAAPLEGEQFEIGFKFQPAGAPFLINASVFQLEETNQVYIPQSIGNALQGVDVKMRGFEIEAVGQVTDNIKVIASYSYTDSENTRHPLDYKVGTPVLGVPEHMASLWGMYTFTDSFWRGLSFGAGVRYMGESVDYGQRYVFAGPYLADIVGIQDFKVVTPSYTLFDAMVAYETDSWRWQITGTNLEDKFYLAQCSARGDCGIGTARTIITGFTYKF